MEAGVFKSCATAVARSTPLHGSLHLEKSSKTPDQNPGFYPMSPLEWLSVALGWPTACRFEHAVSPS